MGYHRIRSSSITIDELCSCRRLGCEAKAADERDWRPPGCNTSYQGSRCWPTSAQWTAKSNKKLPLPSLAPAKPLNRHCMASVRDDTRRALFGRWRAFRIWRSTYPSSRSKVWKPLEKRHLTVFIPVSIWHFGRGPYLPPIWSWNFKLALWKVTQLR